MEKGFWTLKKWCLSLENGFWTFYDKDLEKKRERNETGRDWWWVLEKRVLSLDLPVIEGFQNIVGVLVLLKRVLQVDLVRGEGNVSGEAWGRLLNFGFRNIDGALIFD